MSPVFIKYHQWTKLYQTVVFYSMYNLNFINTKIIGRDRSVPQVKKGEFEVTKVTTGYLSKITQLVRGMSGAWIQVAGLQGSSSPPMPFPASPDCSCTWIRKTLGQAPQTLVTYPIWFRVPIISCCRPWGLGLWLVINTSKWPFFVDCFLFWIAPWDSFQRSTFMFLTQPNTWFSVNELNAELELKVSWLDKCKN